MLAAYTKAINLIDIICMLVSMYLVICGFFLKIEHPFPVTDSMVI